MTRADVHCAAVLLALVACTNPNPPSHAPATTMATAHGAAVAKIDPSANEILDAWASAMGGRDAIDALGALHAKGTYEKGGISGTIELFVTPRGERREEIFLGPIHEVRVFDGTQGWLVDRNRYVRDLAGYELDDVRTQVFREMFAALILDRRAGTVTRDGDKLVLAPEGSKRPDTVTFDRGTRLPETFVRRDAEKMRTTRWSDWNAVGGLKLPFTVREENGNPNDSVTIHWKTLEHGNTTVGMFTKPAETAADAKLLNDPATIPIELVYGGLIFVKVSINDQPMSFVFDTGAEFTLINSSRVSKLGLQGVGTFATGAGGGDVVVSFVPHVTTKVGDASVSDQIVGAVLLDALEGPLKRPVDGILGYDFISRFVVEIDYVKQTMKLYDRATYHHSGAGKPVALTLEDSTPYFDAAIEVPSQGDISGHFVLDTGCLCEVQLFTPFVDEHKLLTALPSAKQAGFTAGAGGTTKQLSATIPMLKVGGWGVPKATASLSRDTSGATADPESAGLIGSLVFKQFVLVLDYKSKQAFLDPLPKP
ncbi:MAG TPA: retropepsin-like aspartic protease [Kofleriaceae bacterium]